MPMREMQREPDAGQAIRSQGQSDLCKRLQEAKEGKDSDFTVIYKSTSKVNEEPWNHSYLS